MIDVGRQSSSLGHGGIPHRDPERCVRDMCRNRLAEESDSFCDGCLAYMRGEE